MQSYFPKALLFKEWRLARWYVVLGIVFFSLGPLQSFVWTLEPYFTNHPSMVEQNVTLTELHGLGMLLIVYSIGLAVLLLTEFYRNTGFQLAAEPIPLRSVILTKFLLGIGIIFTSQGITFLWVWGALSLRHAVTSGFLLYGWWLSGLVLALSFFSVTFMMTLLIRPLAAGLLLTIAAIAAPAMASQWFLIPWRHAVPGGGYEMHLPVWAAQVQHIIEYASPYEIFHHDILFLMRTPLAFTLHAAEPLVWLVIALLASVWSGTHGSSVVEPTGVRSDLSYRSRFTPSLVRGLSTLCAAVVIEHYLLNTTIQRLDAKVAAILFLWFCCYWLLRAFLGYRQTRNNNVRSNWKLWGTKGDIRR